MSEIPEEFDNLLLTAKLLVLLKRHTCAHSMASKLFSLKWNNEVKFVKI